MDTSTPSAPETRFQLFIHFGNGIVLTDGGTVEKYVSNLLGDDFRRDFFRTTFETMASVYRAEIETLATNDWFCMTELTKKEAIRFYLVADRVCNYFEKQAKRKEPCHV